MGIIQGIFTPSVSAPSPKLRLVLLHEVSPESVNRSVVDVYGHSRLPYELSTEGTVKTVLVDSGCLLRTDMVVIDTYWMKKTYGVLVYFHDVADDVETQPQVCFIEVKGFSIYKHSQNVGRKRQLDD